MIKPSHFIQTLKENNIDFFTGVPDSLLKEFCAYTLENIPEKQNIIAANEGNAVAIAAGYHLATNKTAVVYLQNSGQGNTLNPLISLTSKEVYSIPILLVIGWRGQPGIKDEPQHQKQGEITEQLLKTMGIEYKILSKDVEKAKKQIKELAEKSRKEKTPTALIIEKGTFEEYNLQKQQEKYPLKREETLEFITKKLKNNEIIVSTTGKTSRELYEIREKNNQTHEKDFLTVGSMGHSSSIALGIALQKPNRQVIIIDGDGSAIMHMGALAINGSTNLKNLKHIIINNGCHESVGGQPTVGNKINLPEIAKACGYKTILKAENKEQLEKLLNILIQKEETVFLEIKVKKGSRKDLGRPKTTPIENKESFMKFIQEM
jgi:phosphonopyruvate decarboxylase